MRMQISQLVTVIGVMALVMLGTSLHFKLNSLESSCTQSSASAHSQMSVHESTMEKHVQSLKMLMEKNHKEIQVHDSEQQKSREDTKEKIQQHSSTPAEIIEIEKPSQSCSTCPVIPMKFSQCFSDNVASGWQKEALQQNPDGIKTHCSATGVCVCSDSAYIFNGVKCEKKSDSNWHAPYSTLAKKWVEVPFQKENYVGDQVAVDIGEIGADGRASTEILLKMSDSDLVKQWQAQSATDCFTAFYAAAFQNLKMIDIGAGFARQTMSFARHGAHVTFVDVVKSNLEVLKRLAGIFGVADRTKFIHLQNIEQLDSELEIYDAVTAFGSCHHTPHEIMEHEFAVYFKHLNVGARWVQLAYPVNRWRNGGAGTFKVFGQQTDGANTPWGEWYEPGKLLEVFRNSGGNFVNVWCGIVNDSEFIWFDLVYLGPVKPNFGAIDGEKQN